MGWEWEVKGRPTCPRPPQPPSPTILLPGLIDIADDPANSLVFLHEFDGLPTYPWSKVCSPTVPAYICIAADDPEFDRKFGGPQGIKATLEAGLGNSAYLQCAVEVIDARNSSAVRTWARSMRGASMEGTEGRVGDSTSQQCLGGWAWPSRPSSTTLHRQSGRAGTFRISYQSPPTSTRQFLLHPACPPARRPPASSLAPSGPISRHPTATQACPAAASSLTSLLAIGRWR